jgi:hypothetical protein
MAVHLTSSRAETGGARCTMVLHCTSGAGDQPAWSLRASRVEPMHCSLRLVPVEPLHWQAAAEAQA